MKFIYVVFFSLILTSCTVATKSKEIPKALTISKSNILPDGRLVIIQGPTSDQETFINVMSPRLKNYQ